MYPVFSRIFLERSQVTRDSFDTGDGSEMSAAVHNAHYRDHLAKRIRLPVYSCIFLPLCPFQGSSKHNEVLDSKCQTCNLLLVSSFVVRVCLPSAVFFFFFFCEKASCAALLSISEIQRDYKRRGHKGCPPFHAAHRETMDRLVLLGRLSDNTAACDAALEAGIQPRLLLYKWSGPH